LGRLWRLVDDWIERRTVGGEKNRRKYGGKNGKSAAWRERKSVKQEKTLRSDAAETGRKKGIISSSSF